MTDTPTSNPEQNPVAPQPPVDPAGAAGDTAVAPAPVDTAGDAGAPVVEAAPAKKKSAVNNPYFWGTGRRKSSVARVRVKPGSGKFLVNNREVDVYFCLDKDRSAVREPLVVSGAERNWDVFVNVRGGGFTGQAGAVVLGLARALTKANRDYEPKLREKDLMSRDPRRVERKKYGLRGARRSFQFSKR